MSNLQDSLDKIVGAELALQLGDAVRARVLFREAAEMQKTFIGALPRGRVEMRSIYGFSVATLLFKSGDLDAAERYAVDLIQSRCDSSIADGLRGLLVDIQVARGRELLIAKPQEPKATWDYMVTFDRSEERMAEIVAALCSTRLFTQGVAEHVVFYRGAVVSMDYRIANSVYSVLNKLGGLNVKCTM